MNSFRDIYNKTFILKLTKDEQNNLINKDKEYCLCFGYIDSDTGLMALLLNEAEIKNGNIEIGCPLSGKHLHIEDIGTREIIACSIDKTKHRQLIDKYKAVKSVEETRIMDFIDNLRKPDHPDIIRVVLLREGLKEETVWAKITDLLPVQGFIICSMLEEPYQNFGYHEGSSIGVYGKEKDGVVTLYCNMNPLLQIPREKLEDGSLLRAAINNYVRTRVMPGPQKKRYYRVHLAYLIMICTLKQGLSISLVQKLLPVGLPPEEVRRIYSQYAERHRVTAQYFTQQVRAAAALFLDLEPESALTTDRVEDLIASAAMLGGFSRLLAEKLLLLEGRTAANGGSLELLK